MIVPFVKMHGCGNDFVIVDERRAPLHLCPDLAPALAPALARFIANRRGGIGCDQVITLEPAAGAAVPGADVFMRIRNPDGSEAGACGNATRCVADIVMRETGRDAVVVRTVSGDLPAVRRADGGVAVDMGPPRLDWADIPLARPMDTLRLDLALGPVAEPAAASMGNPHATFFVDDLEGLPVETLGPALEHDALFPERANIGFAQVLDPATMRLRVWERGAGLTPACGSGACAALVNAHRRGLVQRRARVTVDGGALEIEWREDGHVVMGGPATTVFSGQIDLSQIDLGQIELPGAAA
ncbi:MAG TPA: diaminopimelate epimerase [Acetobacteraceae bacterium]|nr:diaminopimelate epimerase [Acetobacteraceae bacterium]